jgi:hypothetical protein
MSEYDSSGSLGTKIFFLHPSVVVQNQVVPELAQDEFEVYVYKDEDRLRQGLKKFPDSIVFACINEAMKESAWEEWIRGVMGSPETAGVKIGVVSSGQDDAIKSKYVEQIKVGCGFITMKTDITAVIRQFIAVLNSVNAKGRRKYIRALTDTEPNVTVNIPMNGTYVNGQIKDISAVGFSCSFADDPKLPKNAVFGDLQIRLQTQLLKAEGIIFGSRMEDNQRIYVILFTQRVDAVAKTKIRKYIQSNIQAKMDIEI